MRCEASAEGRRAAQDFLQRSNAGSSVESTLVCLGSQWLRSNNSDQPFFAQIANDTIASPSGPFNLEIQEDGTKAEAVDGVLGKVSFGTRVRETRFFSSRLDYLSQVSGYHGPACLDFANSSGLRELKLSSWPRLHSIQIV